jgi:imidazolonepropionase-like amidohydrolase
LLTEFAKRLRWLFAALVAACLLTAATAAQQTECGRWKLYKFEQAIGQETCQISQENGYQVITDRFEFTDRGSAVPLETTFRAAPDLTPRSFAVKGKTSRWTRVDTTVEVDGAKVKIRQGDASRQVDAPARFFTINGYSPVAQQMLMLRYWLSHGRPASLRILPQGTDVQILPRGAQRGLKNGQPVQLQRYSVAGLIWGREMLWLDPEQRLVALVSTDAEFDHFEAVDEAYQAMLPQFVAEAGQDGMAVLAELSKGLRVEQKGPLAIVGATLVDGTGKAPLPDATVVVNQGRIVAAGPRASVKVPAGATVFDAKGKTLLPGLWDMHAHFEQVEWGPIYLAAGVTTVRDVGNELEFIKAVRDALRDGRGVGPQMFLAGVVDGSGPRAIGVERVDSPADAQHWVGEYKRNGFQQMKIYSSMKLENLKAVCEQAHKLGMTVTGHIPFGLNIYQGVEAGMDQVNHITYVMDALLPKLPEGQRRSRAQLMEALAALDVTGPEAQKEIAFLKEHHTVIDPTVALMELQAHSTATPVASFEPGVAKVAPELAEPLTSGGVPPEAAATERAVIEKELAMIGALHKAGVTIVAGTDQAVPGHSLHREIELYVQAGFTPLEAIQAATIVPARVMGVDKEVGTVEVGKRADLVLLDANPLDDIHNIRTVKYVVANGVLYDSARLWQSVGFKP